MLKLLLSHISARIREPALFSLAAIVLLGGGVALGLSFPSSQGAASGVAHTTPQDIAYDYTLLAGRVRSLEDMQSKLGLHVVDDNVISPLLSDIQLDISTGQYANARLQMKSLGSRVASWQLDLTKRIPPPVPIPTPDPVAVVAPAVPSGDVYIPILLYHYTPSNFDAQLRHLEERGYTTVDLDQVAAALSSGVALPPKSVVLTFDDGFENQMTAFAILKSHHMKATYYIINGGPASRWCIGAGRRTNDPLQPPQGCGDAYLTWDQVRELDASGLITIAGHTIDHSNLPTLSPEAQRHEILDSKTAIEHEIGHPIHHFAYPYGSYNATTIQLVRDAGYSTAVTTLPGSYQSPGGLYTLRRIRDTLSLP